MYINHNDKHKWYKLKPDLKYTEHQRICGRWSTTCVNILFSWRRSDPGKNFTVTGESSSCTAYIYNRTQLTFLYQLWTLHIAIEWKKQINADRLLPLSHLHLAKVQAVSLFCLPCHPVLQQRSPSQSREGGQYMSDHRGRCSERNGLTVTHTTNTTLLKLPVSLTEIKFQSSSTKQMKNFCGHPFCCTVTLIKSSLLKWTLILPAGSHFKQCGVKVALPGHVIHCGWHQMNKNLTFFQGVTSYDICI